MRSSWPNVHLYDELSQSSLKNCRDFRLLCPQNWIHLGLTSNIGKK